VVVIGIIICVQNVFAGLAVIIICGLIVGKHFYTYTNSMRFTKKVISGGLLTKEAVRKIICIYLSYFST
jgi:nitrogen fixation protein FixH